MYIVGLFVPFLFLTQAGDILERFTREVLSLTAYSSSKTQLNITQLWDYFSDAAKPPSLQAILDH
jgi:hypothetical protein